MTRIFTSIVIRKPIDEVFDFATTPGNWPQWHPSSISIKGAIDHSLNPGEQVTEEFIVAGKRGSVVWTTLEKEAPERLVIEGKVGNSGGGTITYTLTPHPDGTKFEREFNYYFNNPLVYLLNRLFIRRRIEAESQKALQQLKSAVESIVSKSMA
jgi:uncharacterized protein YndB with AHSA1/START domain